jgi:hypothetical protein
MIGVREYDEGEYDEEVRCIIFFIFIVVDVDEEEEEGITNDDTSQQLLLTTKHARPIMDINRLILFLFLLLFLCLLGKLIMVDAGRLTFPIEFIIRR